MRSVTLILLLTSFHLICSDARGQEEWGGKIGLNFEFGTHIQRIGVMYQVYYFKKHVSISNAAYLRWNKKGLGPDGSYLEAKIQFGAQGQWINTDKTKFLLNDFSNMSPFLNAAGYNFYVYLDNKQMSQTTGAIFGSISSVMWAIDNDAFGLNQVDDKYRTGGLFLAYQIDSLLLGLQSSLWTANSSGSERVEDPDYPGRYGYRDISQLKYGKFSHGILAFNAQYKWDYDQVARADIGIDSEGIRHFFQNKLIHDGISQRIVKSKSAHYPMLQEDSTMYLFKEGQSRKKGRPYFQLGANDAVFY